jgi:hypothetical protein
MIMNSRQIMALALLGGGMWFAPVTATAAVNYAAGDILVGFQATGGTGAGSNYVYNLGQAATYRDNSNVGAIANLNTDLTNVFGPNWFTRTDLYWAVGGTPNNATFGGNATANYNGDPARAIYASREAESVGSSTAFSNLAAANVNTTSTRMIDMISGYRTTNGTTARDATATSAGNGVIQGIGDINSFTSRVPVSGSPWTTMPANVSGNFGTGTQYAYLDLYRALSDNGSQAFVVEPTPTGQFNYQTTFRIDALGNLSAVPEPTTGLLATLLGVGALFRRRRARA